MRDDLRKLLQILSPNEYHTASELAERLEVSPKTVRTRLKELDELGIRYGVRIETRPRYGIRLAEEREDAVKEMLEPGHEEGSIPNSIEERTDYLLAYLLNHNEYTKIEDICDFLCVSRSTLQVSIRQAEEILTGYQIAIDRRPNYGIRAAGEEFDIRRCIGECFVKRNMLGNSIQIYSGQEIDQLAKKVLELLGKYRLFLPEETFNHVITQIYVALKRIRHGHYVTMPETDAGWKQQEEGLLAEELAAYLEQWQKVDYPGEEIWYIALYLSGVRMLGNADNDSGNFVIREELDRLVVEMLEHVYEEFRIELRTNFHLRMSLNQHMVPFDIRMRYHIHIENPILEEIRQNYVFGYAMAKRACSVLERHYESSIPEDEIGYFAMLFSWALEQNAAEIRRSRILIVCGTGRSSSRMLKYKYEQEFKEYLEKVSVCSLHELGTFDFEQIDYVFTTVPVAEHIPVPLVEVSQFLGEKDAVRVRQVLKRGQMDFLDDYYRKEQMLIGVKGDTKEEVLWNICHEIAKQRELPEGFYEAVLKREELAHTDFGNHIAMPHPYRVITEETFVYVAVLEKEIMWSCHPVSLVFLAAISDREDRNLTRFYEVTTTLFLQEEMVENIIREKDFGVLMQMLRKICYLK